MDPITEIYDENDIIITYDFSTEILSIEHDDETKYSKNYLKKLIKEHANKYLKSKRFKLVENKEFKHLYDVIY